MASKARDIADLGSNDVLETSSTGVDVTGTVTADGLTVDGDASTITLNNTDTSLTIGQTLAKIDIKQNDPSDQGVGTVASIEVENKGSIQGLGQFNFKTGSATANLNRLSIAENGDVSFYEDTGTTAKMVWDASAESLGIGGSPTEALHISNGGLLIDSYIPDAPTNGTSGFIADYFSNQTRFWSRGDATTRGGFVFKILENDGGGQSDAMNIDSSGNVGIGETDPSGYWAQAEQLVISGGNTGITIKSADVGNGRLVFTDTKSSTAGLSDGGMISYGHSSDVMTFQTAGSESARLDSSGNLRVGNTVTEVSSVGGRMLADGRINAITDGKTCFTARRFTSAGDMITLLTTGGSETGSIGVVVNDGSVYIKSVNTGIALGSTSVIPVASNGTLVDNSKDLGMSALRWDDIYATNGTIQTSDRNEKQDIESISDAERLVAQACKGLLRKFRWKDAVEEKGDDARIHFGIIAQDLQDAFSAQGLDAYDYAMFISTTWYEKTIHVDAVEAVAEVLDEDGNIVTEAVEAKEAYSYVDTKEEPTDGYEERTRLGVRYPELLAFIISAL